MHVVLRLRPSVRVGHHDHHHRRPPASEVDNTEFGVKTGASMKSLKTGMTGPDSTDVDGDARARDAMA